MAAGPRSASPIHRATRTALDTNRARSGAPAGGHCRCSAWRPWESCCSFSGRAETSCRKNTLTSRKETKSNIKRPHSTRKFLFDAWLRRCVRWKSNRTPKSKVPVGGRISRENTITVEVNPMSANRLCFCGSALLPKGPLTAGHATSHTISSRT